MRARVQNTTVLDVLDVAIELERKTMALYAGFVRTFQDEDEVRQFWFNMARSEAAHCGALFLVRHPAQENRGCPLPLAPDRRRTKSI